jgi:hypothetical protein
MVGTVAALVELTCIFLHPSFDWDSKQEDRVLVPVLARHGRCPPGYGNPDVNQTPTDSPESDIYLLSDVL